MFRIVVGLVLVLAPLYGASEAEPRMMDLNVVAVDSHGQPVGDMTRDEFRVSDAGKPQTIAFFRHRDTKDGRAPALGPNEFSNRSATNIPRATLILFDLLNEDFGTQGFAANNLIHSLESLESADYLYLYLLTLDGHLYPVHGLPAQPGEAGPPGAAPWTRQIKPLLDGALRTVLQARRTDIDVAIRVPMTFKALDAIAIELSSVPGHKNIVWITDGVPMELGPNRSDIGDYVDYTPLLRRMSDAFDRSGVSLYPARQIMLGSPDNPDGAGRSGISSVATLNELAEMTGGRPDAGKDIGGAVRQAISDARTSYQIGYYPGEKNWDDKIHKLRVMCTRKGVRIQTKTSYYAWRENLGAKSEQAIDSVIPTMFDAGEIGLRGTLSPIANSARTRLAAQIDAQDVVLVHTGDVYDGQLRLAVVGYAPGTEPKRLATIPLDLHYSDQDRDRALQQGISFVQDVTLPEDVRTVRLIVFDRGSNAIGSVTMPVPPATPTKTN
ncbi:MAG TPA: VWA domain-containing protein [Bryobacteraceae bacterium]|nr:VWA domain-containing protein [Bryobacteraceae bacterium]